MDGSRPGRQHSGIRGDGYTAARALRALGTRRTFFLQPEVRRAVRWPESFDRSKIFEAVNIYAQDPADVAAAVRIVGRSRDCWIAVWTNWSRSWRPRAKKGSHRLVSLGWERRTAGEERLAGYHERRLSTRIWNSSKSTIAHSLPTCHFPKPAASFSSTTNRPPFPVGLSWLSFDLCLASSCGNSAWWAPAGATAFPRM